MVARVRLILILLLTAVGAMQLSAADKPKISLDEFFNYVDFSSVNISPDGRSVVIGTTRADWEQNRFRHDLWLYRGDASAQDPLFQLTDSGHDSEPQWSPDGKWVAFLSERKPSHHKRDEADEADSGEDTNQVYLISSQGGEAFPITEGEEEVHSFAWSSDSAMLYFSTRNPWSKQQKDEYKKEWKDAIQYRVSERGDTIFSLEIKPAIARRASIVSEIRDENVSPDATPDARVVAKSPWRVAQMKTAYHAKKLAFVTTSISERQEKVEEFEIYTVELGESSIEHSVEQLTRNQAVEQNLQWSKDDRYVWFTVEVGDVTGQYRDLQPHLYWVDIASHKTEQWGASFSGAVTQYGVDGEGLVVATRLGTEGPLYRALPGKPFDKLGSSPGTYDRVSTSEQASPVAFVYSSMDHPAEVYLADKNNFQNARPITSFNNLFKERELPKGTPYTWTADDNTKIEGMLIYPPGKFGQKNLPMLTLIHGGPTDADGNHFEADWYQWDRLAANDGWLVFEPNYRGSSGYGDEFVMGIVPQIVSRPGKDILEGVDALVKDGTADANRLTVGGYSYGGYMTNWLITQTTRFKAAVTGAGAVEHVGNWGNDDTTFDDAYFLGGEPWQAAQRYHDEAAIFQIDKVKTPTHIVAGASDIRVAVTEDYLLDRALHVLGVPSTLLIFPGEGHSLDKNPWHGKIKVREELKWLQQYGGPVK